MESWGKELDPKVADLLFFSEKIESTEEPFNRMNIIEMPNVFDKVYPPQKKSFSNRVYNTQYTD